LLTSDIDTSVRWIPSKHFQVTDIISFELPRSKKNTFVIKFL